MRAVSFLYLFFVSSLCVLGWSCPREGALVQAHPTLYVGPVTGPPGVAHVVVVVSLLSAQPQKLCQ